MIENDPYTTPRNASKKPPFIILVCFVGQKSQITSQRNALRKVMNPRQETLTSCSTNAFSFSGPSCIRKSATYAGRPISQMVMLGSVSVQGWCWGMRDGHHQGYVWTQWWGVDSRNVATVARSDPYITPETVIGHFTVPPGSPAWSVGMMVTSRRSAPFRGLPWLVVRP